MTDRAALEVAKLPKLQHLSLAQNPRWVLVGLIWLGCVLVWFGSGVCLYICACLCMCRCMCVWC